MAFSRGPELQALLDFVISSHVLVHTPNPGRVLEEWMRIVRPGGVVYFVIPDKTCTSDKTRALTSVTLLLEKYTSNTATAEYDTYYDAMVNAEGGEAVTEERVRKRFEEQVSIHVHTFTPDSINHFVAALAPKIGFGVVRHASQGMHIHVALKKLDVGPRVERSASEIP